MISNEAELESVQAHIREFQDRLRALFKREDLSHFEVHLTATGYDKLIGGWREEIAEFERRQKLLANPAEPVLPFPMPPAPAHTAPSE